MGHSYIRCRVARCNRNLLIINLGALLIVGGLAWLFQNEVADTFSEPFPLDRKALTEASSPGDLPHRYVTLAEDELTDTGFRETSGIIFTKETDVLALPIGQRFLLVKTEPHAVGPRYTGALTRLPKEWGAQMKLYRDLDKAGRHTLQESLRGLNRGQPKSPATVKARGQGGRRGEADEETPDWHELSLPVILDTTDHPSKTLVSGFLAVLVLMSALFLWNSVKALIRIFSTNAHPIYRSLERYGPAAEVAARIDAEADLREPQSVACGDKVLVTPSWLLTAGPFMLGVNRLDEVIWVYKKSIRHRRNFVYTHTTWTLCVVLRDRSLREIDFDKDEGKADRCLREVVSRRPWVLSGYDEQLAATCRTSPSILLMIVEDRRKELLAKGFQLPFA